ncbi:MAG: DNA mismatch repair protein MutS, partial [Bacteroidales bacterium]|nr:DNA mismatch repair protein MutS [Bacteroidales bacterium]
MTSIKKPIVETPLMKQYYAIKAKYPDALLLFRVGDFYETFGKDAIITSKILGIVLTRRANGKASFVELAGFPHHALDTYLPKLVKAGQRVAICDQLEDPKLTKKIVKRGVTELVTPGVSYNENVLDHKENNYLAGVQYDTERSGIAFLDVTTGEFYTAEGTNDYIDKLLRSFNPSEVIIQRNKEKAFLERFGNFYTNCFDDWVFTHEFGYEKLIRHFGTNSLKGYGIEELTSGIIASGVVLHYLSETHHTDLQHLNQIQRIDEDRYVWLDRFTIRNLELLYSANDNATTLIDIIDRTITPMGSRLLKRWIVLPQKELQIINERLDLVEHFIQQTDLATKVVECLKQVGDLERLVSKISTGRITPREVIQLQKSLISITPVKDAFTQSKMPALKKI